MKKSILSLAITLGLAVSSYGQSTTLSQMVLAGTMTNLSIGPFRVNQIIITSTNTSTGQLVDSTTNSLVYVLPAYTNTISYLTNSAGLATNGSYNQFFYTNYYGVVTYITNSTGSSPLVQVDVTNNVVSSQTNSLPSIYVFLFYISLFFRSL